MPARVPALRRWPIRARLTIAFAGVLAAMLTAAGVVLYTEFARDFDDAIDRDLAARLTDVSALVVTAPDPSARLDRSGERVAQLYAADGRVIASTPGLTRARILSGAEARDAARHALVLDDRGTPVGEARVRAAGVTAPGGRRLVVAVGEPLVSRDRALARLRDLLFIAGPFALLLASYAGYQVARAALRPVERMRIGAEKITEHDTGERLPVPASRDEIEALGHTLNELLARLDAALARERRLLSDASHELRTPLTVLRTEIQLALRGERDPSELRAALESAGHEAERLSRLADDLLVLARSDQGRLPIRPEPLDAGELLEAAARRARSAAGASGRRIRAQAADAAVLLADPDRVAQALDNLAANALAYGSGDLLLFSRAREGWIELHVRDEGEGFPQEFLGRAFERFSQADRARSGTGAGLGLAIVAAIARAHGGDAGARNLPERGADVWISLPAA